jgi:glycosidase
MKRDAVPIFSALPSTYVSAARLARPWLPVSRPGPEWTVAHQREDPASVLSLVRALIRARAEHPAIGDGEYTRLPATDPGVFAFTLSAGAHRAVVVANLGDDEVPVPADAGARATILVSSESDPEPATLRPVEARVLGSATGDR